MSTITVLDCTFRDGGYYTNWDFSRPLVASYLAAIEAAKVDVVEIGFRSPPQDRFLGAFGYSTDDFLSTLPLPKSVRFGVMVNAKEIVGYPKGIDAACDLLFKPATESPLDLVRIACHFAEIAKSAPVAARLKEKGYQVGFNIMQASTRPPNELTQAAAAIQKWGSVDVLYIADSLGNMTPAAFQEAIGALAKGWDGPIGAHTHNNMGQGVANALAGIHGGATWLDGTVLGMGRGAGNAGTEYLLLELKRKGVGNYNPDALFPLVMDQFENLREQHGWGPHLLYYLSAVHGIHPTYVQELLSRWRYDHHQVLSAMEFLKHAGAGSYSDDHLEQAISSGDGPGGQGTWSATGWSKGRDVMVVAPGAGTRQHLEALVRFIDQRQPVVIPLNVGTDLPLDKATAFAACHQTRLLMDADRYRELKRPVICPMARVPEMVRPRLGAVEVLDFGLEIRKDTFDVTPRGCAIPNALTAPYAMALAEAGGAARILLVGFDGYGATDPRHAEMNDILRLYQRRSTAVPMLAITPTTYDIPKGSIYSPDL